MNLLDSVQYSVSINPIPFLTTCPFVQSMVGAFELVIVEETEVGSGLGGK